MQITTTTQQAAEVGVAAVNEAKKGTGTIGFGQITNTTPNWSTWMFRIVFYVWSFSLIWMGFDQNIPADFVKNYIAYGGMIIMGIHGFSKMWGIDTKKIQAEAIEAFQQAQQ